jgi:hypothetical protein
MLACGWTDGADQQVEQNVDFRFGGAPKFALNALADRHDKGQGRSNEAEAVGASALRETVARDA